MVDLDIGGNSRSKYIGTWVPGLKAFAEIRCRNVFMHRLE